MLNRCSTDIYLEYEVQLILSEIEAVEDILIHEKQDADANASMQLEVLKKEANLFNPKERHKLIKALTAEMSACADRMEYEQAAALRDQIRDIEAQYGK